MFIFGGMKDPDNLSKNSLFILNLDGKRFERKIKLDTTKPPVSKSAGPNPPVIKHGIKKKLGISDLPTSSTN